MCVAVSAIAVAACSNGAVSGSTAESIPAASSKARPNTQPTGIQFKYETIDDGASTTSNLSGVNQLGKIVGTYGTGTASDPYGGFTSRSPYSRLDALNYPQAAGTIAEGVSSNKIVVGAVVSPSSLRGTWGFVWDAGAWTLVKDREDGGGKDSVTELTAINDSGLATGYYVNPSTHQPSPVEFNLLSNQFINLDPDSGVKQVATGINGKGDIVGYETGSGGKYLGWFYRTGSYFTIAHAGDDTQLWGINWQDELVGSYKDKSGVTHGFILTDPTGSQQWQFIDEPNAAGTTVVTDINNHNEITGWYVDSNGNANGFVGLPQGSR
ncbi:MAG: hypothetical protein JO113_00175 [Candidatus Eremiobacteraeota bacterium]|nr:hypothetical protein [Candidatus Eremiobacteraeota bacterium]